MRRSSRKTTLRWNRAIAIAPALIVLSLPTAAPARGYSTARFRERTNRYAYGQAPVFMPGGTRVVFGKDFRKGQGNQVYIAGFPGGGHLRCLTCQGPDSGSDNVNGVPAVRPQGDWILFHSWRGIT